MSIAWGPWTGKNSTHRVRVGIEKVSVPTPSANQSAVTVVVKIWAQCKWYFYETATISWSGTLGSGSESRTITFPSSNSTILLKTLSASVGVQYGAVTPVSVKGSVTNINYIGNSYKPSKTLGFSIPARPYRKPAKPTSVTRSPSGSKWLLKFPSPSTTSAPAHKRQIQLSRNGGSYFTLGHTSGTSWKTAQAKNNGRYRARARAKNSSGASGWTYSSYWKTKPSAPENVQAVKQGLGQIDISWTKKSSYADSYQIRHFADDADQGVIASVSGSASSYTATGLDTSKIHRFAVSAKTTEGFSFESSETSSNEVQLDSPPYAPTGLNPNGLAKDAQQSIKLSWQFNSADSSAQTAYEIRYRRQGTASWTALSGSGGSTEYELPADTWTNGDTFDWQVRTKAQHPDWGAWSATAVVVGSTPPAVAITSPAEGDVLESNQVTVAWNYVDEEGDPQQWASVSLIQDGSVVAEAQTSTSDARSLGVAYTLANNASYAVQLIARDSAGLTAEPDVVAFSTLFAPPPSPEVTLVWVDGMAAVELLVVNPGGDPEPVANLVERSLDGGNTWQELGSIELDSSYYDPYPLTRGETRYRVSSLSDLPSSSDPVEVLVAKNELDAWITYGSDESEAVCVPYNLVVPVSYSPLSTTHKFLGRSKPVSLYNLDMPSTREVSVSGVHLGGCFSEEVFNSILAGDVFYRDPAGRRFWACITSSTVNPREWGSEVSFKLKEVEGRG